MPVMKVVDIEAALKEYHQRTGWWRFFFKQAFIKKLTRLLKTHQGKTEIDAKAVLSCFQPDEINFKKAHGAVALSLMGRFYGLDRNSSFSFTEQDQSLIISKSWNSPANEKRLRFHFRLVLRMAEKGLDLKNKNLQLSKIHTLENIYSHYGKILLTKNQPETLWKNAQSKPVKEIFPNYEAHQQFRDTYLNYLALLQSKDLLTDTYLWPKKPLSQNTTMSLYQFTMNMKLAHFFVSYDAALKQAPGAAMGSAKNAMASAKNQSTGFDREFFEAINTLPDEDLVFIASLNHSDPIQITKEILGTEKPLTLDQDLMRDKWHQTLRALPKLLAGYQEKRSSGTKFRQILQERLLTTIPEHPASEARPIQGVFSPTSETSASNRSAEKNTTTPAPN